MRDLVCRRRALHCFEDRFTGGNAACENPGPRRPGFLRFIKFREFSPVVGCDELLELFERLVAKVPPIYQERTRRAPAYV